MKTITVQIKYDGEVELRPQDIFNAFVFSIWKLKLVSVVAAQQSVEPTVENAAVVCPSCNHSFMVSIPA